MSGMDLNAIMDWLAKNGWWAVLTTVFILIGSYSGLFSMLAQYVNRPKLFFEPRKEIKAHPEDNSKIISFWVSVTNEGKRTSSQCSAQVLVTNYSRDLVVGKTSIPSTYGMLPIKWQVGKQSYDTLDIYPSYTEGILKIPINIGILINEKANPPFNYPYCWIIPEDPLEKFEPIGTLHPNDKNLIHHLLCYVFIHYQSETHIVKFEIKCPIRDSPIKPDEIIFDYA